MGFWRLDLSHGGRDGHTVPQILQCSGTARKNGVGYGKWMNIDGWSDSVIEYIRALEQTRWVN
jgi:hypothetical protein